MRINTSWSGLNGAGGFGKKQTDKVEFFKNLISGSRCEVHSRLGLDLISRVQAVVVERTQPADPLVLNSF